MRRFSSDICKAKSRDWEKGLLEPARAGGPRFSRKVKMFALFTRNGGAQMLLSFMLNIFYRISSLDGSVAAFLL